MNYLAKIQPLDLIAGSLSDVSLRAANTYVLQDVVDNKLPSSLRLYLKDPNHFVVDNVLCGLMANQQVDVIPRVVLFAEGTAKADGSGTSSLLALENLTAPSAVPYLNPLLFHHNEYVRLNAMEALLRLANRSSIPYLLLALSDPDSQDVVAPMAYQKSYEMVPSLGFAYSTKYFDLHRAEIIAKANKWWKEELRGEHLTTGKGMPHVEAPVTLSFEKQSQVQQTS